MMDMADCNSADCNGGTMKAMKMPKGASGKSSGSSPTRSTNQGTRVMTGGAHTVHAGKDSRFVASKNKQ